jgi:hypothetical protein
MEAHPENCASAKAIGSGGESWQLMPFNDLLDNDQFHNSEVTDLGPALNAVRFISIDREAAAQRNLGYIRSNIAREKAYQEKLALTTVV